MHFARSTFSRMMAAMMLILAVLGVSVPAAAQDIFIRAALAAEGPVEPGGETTLAIKFSPVSDEWHGYWSNPGDAGLPMQLDWNLPEGVELGEPLYPVPKRLVIDGIMNHIFEGDFAVLVPLRLSEDYAGGEMLTLSAEAFYLACTNEICVPQQATLQASVPVGAGAAPSADFTRYRSAIAPLIDSVGSFEVVGDLLRMAIPIPANVDVGEPHLFVANRELGDGLQPAYSAPQGFTRQGDMLVAEVPLSRLVLPEGSDIEFAPAPQSLQGIVAWSDSEGLRFTARPGAVPTGGTVIMARESDMPPLWLLLGGALLGGLLLNVMPCVFPILSLKALSLVKAGASESAARTEGLAYTAGVVLACAALGGVMLALRAAGEQVGWAFQLQEPAVVVALLVLAALITANLWGVFELPGLSITEGSTPRGAFSTGLLAAFVATPCTGPFMAAALGAALLLPAPLALLLFAMLGLGLALPFLLLGFVPALRNRLPKPGPWMVTFRKLMAVPMALTVLALVWLLWRMGGAMFAVAAVGMTAAIAGAVSLALGSAMQSEKMRRPLMACFGAIAILLAIVAAQQFERPQSGEAVTVLDSKDFSAEALQQARATGQPVFVYFTADWCVSCKVNERVAIEREETRAAFEQAGVITLRGDWTLREPEITAFLNERGVAGVPLYLWYDPGAAEPDQLPQLLGPDALIDRARQEPARQDREAAAPQPR